MTHFVTDCRTTNNDMRSTYNFWWKFHTHKNAFTCVQAIFIHERTCNYFSRAKRDPRSTARAVHNICIDIICKSVWGPLAIKYRNTYYYIIATLKCKRNFIFLWYIKNICIRVGILIDCDEINEIMMISIWHLLLLYIIILYCTI